MLMPGPSVAAGRRWFGSVSPATNSATVTAVYTDGRPL